MHCLRWWLPIFLLPLPAASPFLTLLFIATYAIRTRPCAYCSVIILGLMFSTCAFYSYEAPSAIGTAVQERLLTLRDQQALTSSINVPARLDVPSSEEHSSSSSSSSSSASSCWIDLSCGMLSSSDKSTNDVPPASQLGWWSAPTRRRKPTVLRQNHAVGTMNHGSTKLTFFKPVRQWYDHLRSDGLWIGLGQDSGFRLKFIAD